MKVIKLIVLFVVPIFQNISAQDNQRLFEQANELYQQENYMQAIQKYKQIEKGKVASDALYYNMGNAYYKLNQIAFSIYYYEKALKYNPSNKDAQNNLSFANLLTIDKVEQLPRDVFEDFYEKLRSITTYNSWSVIWIIISFIGAIAWLFYYFSYRTLSKKIFFISGFILTLLWGITSFITYSSYEFYKNNIQAILFADQMDVKDSPSESGEILFEIHQGIKMKVLDSQYNWKKIRIADGKEGWVPSESLREF